VIDATYTDEEYLKKIGWGHSAVSRVVDVADKANVKQLCLFHHDPDQFDSEIAAKLKFAKNLLKERGSKVVCVASVEGTTITI
jgi:ribonuclease BN (tRNA processing enzyme)